MKKTIEVISLYLSLLLFFSGSAFAIILLNDLMETPVTGYDPAKWSSVTGSTWTRDATYYVEGSSSARATDDGSIQRLNYSIIGYNNLTIRAYVKISDVSATDRQFVISFWNSDMTSLYCMIGKRYDSDYFSYYDGSYHQLGLANNSWNKFEIRIINNTCAYYLNDGYVGNYSVTPSNVRIINIYPNNDNKGTFYYFDDVIIYDSEADVLSIAVKSNTYQNHSINFTSDGSQPCGYNLSGIYTTCGPTQDGTPTVRFNTNGQASCKLSNQALNYSILDSQSVDCSTTGSTEHVCTYPDALVNGTNTLYVSCKSGNTEMNNFSSYPSNVFNISIIAPISNSSAHANDAIELGITKSVIWPGAIIYTSQPLYVRTKNNSQAFAIFDKVALYGNQRWAFNYMIWGEPSVGAFYNISPVFYFWEKANLSYFEVSKQVSSLINTTKT